MVSLSPTSKIALITGANQGIGFATARKLANEFKDFLVLIGARDEKRGAEAVDKLKKEDLAVELQLIDVTDDASILAAAKHVEQTYGRLDVLINNAGIAIEGANPTTAETMRAVFRQTFEVNVFGAAVVTEAFAPLLSKSSAPRVVFLSSGLGSVGQRTSTDDPFAAVSAPAYRSSKSAVNMLTANYAHLYKRDGWKVNACCPGYVATAMNGYSGPGTVEEAAINVVRLATLGEDGETATYSNRHGPLPW